MKKVITAFKEHKEFKKQKPWDSTVMTFPNDEIVPPHYADTIEVLLCYGVLGDIHIGGCRFSLEGKKVFFIPPNVVHSLNYKKNNGQVTVLKINIKEFKPMLDINAVLAYYGRSFDELPYCISEYDKVKVIADCFSTSGELTDITASIMQLINILFSQSVKSEDIPLHRPGYNDELCKIIVWTEEHFAEKISLESASEFAGYDKHYFCNKFKSATGITYLNYLNTLRIHHACNLLKSGVSVKQACDECGFLNTSYFIKLFKKITGVTPKKYSTDNL